MSECRREAFRLEVRDSYEVPAESEPLRRFLAGEPFDLRAWSRDWTSFVRELIDRGAGLSRVRVVTEPHSDYQRWLLHLTKINAEAGEDIRYIPRHLAGEVPPDDFWLVDGRMVVFNLADADGRSVGGSAVTTDPQIVAYCQRVRERLWPMATPYTDYASAQANSTR